MQLGRTQSVLTEAIRWANGFGFTAEQGSFCLHHSVQNSSVDKRNSHPTHTGQHCQKKKPKGIELHLVQKL